MSEVKRDKGKKTLKGDKYNNLNHHEKRKKGAPKWKRVETEIDQLNKRIEEETPPSGVLYYKYRPENEKDTNEEVKNNTVSNRNIEETSDKNKIKIRFSDLAISKATVSGL
jgi:uncharacterized lipoprotein